MNKLDETIFGARYDYILQNLSSPLLPLPDEPDIWRTTVSIETQRLSDIFDGFALIFPDILTGFLF